MIEEAHTQARRLISLVHDLLLLYQLEGATPGPPKELGNLSDVCRRVLSQLQPIIGKRALRIRTNLPDDAHIQALPTHIDMLVRNLIENAVKYAVPKSEVRIDLGASPGQVELVVFNQCDAAPGWIDEKLFEPFSRPDSSRNSETGGTGLGVAICRALAQ